MEESSHKPAFSGSIREGLKKFLIINVGVLLISVGVYFFKFPNNFTTGGVSGLAIILGRLVPVPWLSPAVMMGAINMILLVIGFIFLGKGFGFWTAYCSLMYSFETWVMEVLYPMDGPFTEIGRAHV